MAQIQKGFTFTDGPNGTSANLNAVVDNAILLPGAISDQTAAAPVAADSFIFWQSASTALRKCTLTQVLATLPVDAATTTPSLRTLGYGAFQAAQGNQLPAAVTGIRKSAGAGNTDVAAAPKDFAFAPVNLSGGLAINWDSADLFYDTLTGSTNHTYTFSNVRAGRVITVVLKTLGYTGTLTWPTLLGAAPVLTPGSTVHYFTFINTALGTSGIVKAL